jgi:hypothetical protein
MKEKSIGETTGEIVAVVCLSIIILAITIRIVRWVIGI